MKIQGGNAYGTDVGKGSEFENVFNGGAGGVDGRWPNQGCAGHLGG